MFFLLNDFNARKERKVFNDNVYYFSYRSVVVAKCLFFLRTFTGTLFV